MSTDSVQILEFDEILEELAGHCEFSVAQDRAMEIGPSQETGQVEYLLQVTREAVELLTEHPDASVRGVRDIRDIVDRSAKGLLLAPHELRLVLDTVQAVHGIRRRFDRFNDNDENYPALGEFAEAITFQSALEGTLDQTVSSRGEILDSASPDLGRIRSEVKVAQRRLTERLNRIISDSTTSQSLQEPIITQRDGRYVVPVRSDRRSGVPGVVHGTSSSGQTLFVEPMAIVELNNRWRELQMAEEHEVERILRYCSDLIGQQADALRLSVEATAALDLAFAKARYSFELDAVEPLIAPSTSSLNAQSPEASPVFLDEARHPLLPQSEVVPLTVHLGGEFRILVVTGPNTGGKTVALKTVGLLSLMAQSGMFIPARDGSRLPVFAGVYADIGDEQSIEQSLSTFSSHMTRIVRLLRAADERSLVLLDEIGAGTDPQEGSALAQSIIQTLIKQGCLGIVTTHYSELKSFAYTTDGVENASVEFDVRTLRPTYRMLVGIPGRSNALAIAERLGLSRDVLELARSYLDPGAERTDEMVDEIRRQRDLARSLRAEARKERHEVDRLRAEVEKVRQEAEIERAQAHDEAVMELRGQLDEARKLIRRLESASMSTSRGEQAAPASQVKQARETLDNLEKSARQKRKARPPSTPARPQNIETGDTVEIPSLGLQGEVVSIDHYTRIADIQAGSFKLQQPLSGLKRVSRSKIKRQSETMSYSAPPAPMVENEIHFRGQRAAEVERELERYLDTAAHASLPWVRIVHGKGTGALRTVVRTVLRRHPSVSHFELAPLNEGGQGVTIAYLAD